MKPPSTSAPSAAAPDKLPTPNVAAEAAVAAAAVAALPAPQPDSLDAQPAAQVQPPEPVVAAPAAAAQERETDSGPLHKDAAAGKRADQPPGTLGLPDGGAQGGGTRLLPACVLQGFNMLDEHVDERFGDLDLSMSFA